VSECEVAVPANDRCADLAEYRLEDLARISGVSTRNIRAYRERGLLDPPGRQGRSAFYDDYHLSQLKTINQLLRKGFNSAHIAEFFARMREGHDLAAILGVQQAILGGGNENTRPVAVRPLATLDAMTTAGALKVRWRHGLIGTMARRGDKVRLRLPDRTITFPDSCAPALEALQHGLVAGADALPGLDHADSTVLIRRLLREAVVVTATE